MKLLLVFVIIFSANYCYSQTALSAVLVQFSDGWKKDSLSCEGYRDKVAGSVLKSRIDSVSKDFLFKCFGPPNKIQKFTSGLRSNRKTYVGYIYIYYSDACPKWGVQTDAVQFIIVEGEEDNIAAIEEINYCG